MMQEQVITLREFKIMSLTVLLAICGSLGIDIHLASLPYIMQDMHTDKQHMQQSVTLFILGVGLSMLIYGPLSDKIGRKKVVFFGLTLASISSFSAALVTTITPFLLLRLLQGIGSGVCWGLGRIIAADVMQGERLAAIGSYFTLFLSLSPLLAPALGGYIQAWFGWQANFIVLGSIVLTVLCLFILFFEETNLNQRQEAFEPVVLIKTYWFLLTNRLYIGCTILTGLAMSANILYTTISSFIFQQQFHTSPIMYGWLTAVVGGAGILGKLVSPLFIMRLKNHKTLLLGIVLLLFSGLFLSFFSLMGLISIPTVLIGVSIAIFALIFIGPVTMSMALSPFHDKRGSAGAMFGSFQLLIAFAVSSAAASIPHLGTNILGISYLLLGGAAFLAFYLFIQSPKIVSNAKLE